LAYAAPVIGGANWSLLNAGGTALTGAQTITVSGISSKDKVMVLISGSSSASATSEIGIRLNTDTGSNYIQVGGREVGYSPYDPSNVSTVNSTAADVIFVARMMASATGTVSGGAIFTGCNASGVKQYISLGGANSNGSDGFNTNVQTLGAYTGSSVISSISVFSSIGNFDAGTVYVYTSA